MPLDWTLSSIITSHNNLLVHTLLCYKLWTYSRSLGHRTKQCYFNKQKTMFLIGKDKTQQQIKLLDTSFITILRFRLLTAICSLNIRDSNGGYLYLMICLHKLYCYFNYFSVIFNNISRIKSTRINDLNTKYCSLIESSI